MRLFIVRHGRTVWNEKKRTQGRVHNRLSSFGVAFSKEVAEKLKDIEFDYIFSSPLLRAVQTANIINKFHNNKVVKDERLTDIDQGVFTGRYFESLSEEELAIKKSKDKNYGMESLKEMYDRTSDFYNYIKNHYSDSTILVVTHSGNASFLEMLTSCSEYDPNVFNRTDLFQNSEVKEFLVKN